jgi:hypothetical protein
MLCLLPLAFFDADRENSAAELRRATERAVHRLRYEKSEGILPEGDFTRLKAFEPGESPALTVTMERPRELYLRGYVGEIYIGNGWAALEAEQRGRYATLFSWLHERDFYGQEQYALLCGALGRAGKTQTVSVRVLDACTGQRYAPYELLGADADARRIGDEKIPAAGLRGETEYSLRIAEHPVGDYEAMALQLSLARKEGGAAAEYSLRESAYRKYAHENYLAVPAQTTEAISEYLSGLKLPEDGRISFQDARTVVSAYLGAGLSYSEKPAEIGKDSDFFTAFINETKEGYSVHYATAATLLFRHLGFPARYVEGWHITEDVAMGAAPGEAIAVHGGLAHAWAEVYRDGVGFVPFEAAPPHADPKGQSGGGMGGGASADDEQEDEPASPWTAIALLSGLLALLALAALALAARRWAKRRKLARMLGDPDPSTAVSNITTWSLNLLAHMGISRRNASLYSLSAAVEELLGSSEGFRGMIAAQQRALFSQGGVAVSEVIEANRFMAEVEAMLRHYGRWHDRFRLKWLKCVI